MGDHADGEGADQLTEEASGNGQGDLGGLQPPGTASTGRTNATECGVSIKRLRDDLTKCGMAALAHFRQGAMEEDIALACDLDSGLSRFVDAAVLNPMAIITLGTELEANQQALAEHIQLMAPGVLDIRGVGPVTAAIILAAYSHHDRVRSEAAFAALAGASPIPASSCNTHR